MLPPDTEHVWNFLKEQSVLAGFVLIAGSGLALRIGHRVSEDLDLVFLGPRLPRARLEVLWRLGHEVGFEFQRNDDEISVQEFANTGLDLHDYQQKQLRSIQVKITA